ncbi:MAG: RICIN domain-containing protein [Microcoleus sp.]
MTTNIKKIDINNIVEIATSFDEFKHEPLLNEIQGNIVKSHGRNHAVYLFLKFKSGKYEIEAAKQWIGNFTHRYVDSALQQAEQAKLHRHKKNVPGKLFANFFLTRAGYMHLGYEYHQLPNEDAFRQGMQDANMQNELGDDISQWDEGFQKEIHALVLLAGDRIVGSRTEDVKKEEQKDKTTLHKPPALLERKVTKIEGELKPIAEVVHKETGYVLRDEKQEEIEHFGFRDGVSQPLFLKRDIDKAEEENGDFDKWDPRAPLSLVLFKDPLGKEQESYGSFLVFRKLEQNVGGWNRDVVKLARALGMLTKEATEGVTKQTDQNGAVREPMPNQPLNDWMEKMGLTLEERQKVKLAEAYTMGRFRDGTPVVIADRDNEVNKLKHPDTDNFNYEDDSEGSKCPFFAHTRKVNPRGDTGNPNIVQTPIFIEEEKMHRIVRRGITYGKPTPAPEGDVGLLFMCFQASLISQFNFMQQAWAKQRHFVKRDVGTDVVIGVEKRDIDPDIENDPGKAPGEQYNWPTEYGEGETKEVTFKHWITMRGGEFFFAPSMSFLKSLALAPSLNIEFRGVPEKEIASAQNMIAKLHEYQKENFAIGLHGDTTQPDEFLTFFNQRKLPFEFYLINKVSLGDYSAYEKNIATLIRYIKDVIIQEIDACEYKIAELQEYKTLNWAIGLSVIEETNKPNKYTKQLDGFVNFFGERELPFEFYVHNQSASVLLGDNSAYSKNIKTLEDYITKLNQIKILKPVKVVAKKLNASGKCRLLAVAAVDIESISLEDKTNAFVSSNQTGNYTQWLLEAVGDGSYYLVLQHDKNQSTDMVLGTDTQNDLDSDKTNVCLRNKYGGPNQKWKLDSVGDGSYYLQAQNGNVLTTHDADGANVFHADKQDNNDNQKWEIQKWEI